VKQERIIDSAQRAELLRPGGELDLRVGDLLQVVKPDTYRHHGRDLWQTDVFGNKLHDVIP
jgi:hypothetical protein